MAPPMDGHAMAAPHTVDPTVRYPSPTTSVSPYYPAYAHHHPYPVPPPPPQHQVPTYVRPDQQHIHTLFVSGLPDDVLAREIHNLFRTRPGFQSCQLKYTGRGNQVVAFATFYDHYAAVAAMNQLNGRLFDPEAGATLHVELARSNSRTKMPPGSGVYTVIDDRDKLLTRSQEAEDDGDSGSDEPSDTDNPNPSHKGNSIAATQSNIVTGDSDNDKVRVETNTAGVTPCSTLFIANLGPCCTEEELKEALSKYAGFRLLKMRTRGSMPVAFADFQEIKQATEAMNSLQGSLLSSSDRGGLHLEYAKSKMKK